MSERSPGVVVLSDARDTPEAASTAAASCLALGEALVSGPVWRLFTDAVLVARTSPAPLLAVVGSFDEADTIRLEALQWQLATLGPRTTYVDYAQAEEDCRILAERLLAHFGRDSLSAMSFAAIPRGGFVVLGMLAYALDIAPAQLAAQGEGSALVVVDDCALSGERFRQYLNARPESSVVFAHLYSHPDLRRAIEESEERVTGVYSAQDLTDYAPAVQGDDYPSWRARWDARPGSGYWTGMPASVVFAWNEPDVSIWNSVTNRSEPGWRLTSPDLVLKNRPPPDASYAGLQVMPDSAGAIRFHPDAVYAVFGEEVVVANVATGESVRLDAIATSMWSALTETGDVGNAVTRLAREFDAAEDQLEEDLRELLDQLVEGAYLQVVEE